MKVLGYQVFGKLKTYRRKITQEEYKKSFDMYFIRYEVWHKKLDNLEDETNGFDYLGYEEEEDDTFITQTAYWAESGKYKYVGKE